MFRQPGELWGQTEERQPPVCTCGLVGLASQAHTDGGSFALLTVFFSYKCRVCIYVCAYAHVFLLGHCLTYVHLCNYSWSIGPFEEHQCLKCLRWCYAYMSPSSNSRGVTLVFSHHSIPTGWKRRATSHILSLGCDLGKSDKTLPS